MDMDTCIIIHLPKLHPHDLQTLAKSTCFPEKGATWLGPLFERYIAPDGIFSGGKIL